MDENFNKFIEETKKALENQTKDIADRLVDKVGEFAYAQYGGLGLRCQRKHDVGDTRTDESDVAVVACLPYLRLVQPRSFCAPGLYHQSRRATVESYSEVVNRQREPYALIHANILATSSAEVSLVPSSKTTEAEP